ncbi:TPA: hypothetical protein JFU91_002439 [Enterococcus faecium]|nr:hypothetical protein [Enterococcus faecium]
MAGSGRAEVPFARFQAWADAIKGERVTFAEMARVTGATTPTYSRANAQGAVGVRHVVSYARGVGESPLEALRAALPWPFLVEDPEPSTAEWVSQSPHALILGELATRFGGQPAPTPWPSGGTSVARWLDAITPRRREAIRGAAASVGIGPDVYLTKKRRGSFTLTELSGLASIGGHSARIAVVAQGVLTWEEVGLDGAERARTLAAMPSVDLLEAVEGATGQMKRELEHRS